MNRPDQEDLFQDLISTLSNNSDSAEPTHVPVRPGHHNNTVTAVNTPAFLGTTPPTISFLENFVLSGNGNTGSNRSEDNRSDDSNISNTGNTGNTRVNTNIQSQPQQPQPQQPFQQNLNIPRPFSPGVTRPPSVDWTLRLFRLEDFIFGKTVGTGTFGRVRLVRLRAHDKFFAMKVMAKSEILRLHQVDHIFSEKFLLSRLSCPFIIRLYSTFQDEQFLYMLLEYAIGGELFTYLRRAGRFSPSTTRFYAAQIVLALEYMHGLGIVYRDLKPENLLLDQRGNIKIADFGFAKVIPENRTWTLCGTPEYLAPEIILGRGHGRPVDWWALGILIYEMAAGYPPFYDETPFQIYDKILAGVLEFPDHFDVALKDLISSLLIADPVRRMGCGRGGAGDVKGHAFFAGVDWTATARRESEAPFVPPVRHAGDTGNFEEYPEDENGHPVELRPAEASIFIDF